MTHRMPAPDSVIADLENTILPSRACLLAVRDTMCAARRLAIVDAARGARRALRGSDDEASAATLACIWEAICALDLAANVAAPWVDPRLTTTSGPWVQMTHWDGGQANRFYESSHKWSDARFAVLSAHVFRHGSNDSAIEAWRSEAAIDDPHLLAALEEAQQATARFLRAKFEELAKAWKIYRGHAASYEHGLQFVPASLGQVVNALGEPVVHPLKTLHSRKNESLGLSNPLDEIIEHADAIGTLASDVAEHVAYSRLKIFDSLEIDPDGSVWMVPWQDPFAWWFKRGDVSEDTLARLQAGLRMTWVSVDD